MRTPSGLFRSARGGRRPTTPPLLLAAAVLLLPRLTPLARADTELATDAQRSAFATRREVVVSGTAAAAHAAAPTSLLPEDRPGFAELPLPPELAGSSEPAYHDLRLVRGDGREVPYLLALQTERHEVESESGQLTSSLVSGTNSVWVVDLLQPRSFDAIELQVDGELFAKQVMVEGATERSGPFRTLRAGAGIFDLPWSAAPGFRVRHTTVEWEQVQTARYLRLTVNDLRSRPIALRGVTAVRNRAVKAQMWTRPAPLLTLAEPPRSSRHAAPEKSRYRLDLPPGLPVEQLLIRAQELALVRPVRLFELPRNAAPRSGAETGPAAEAAERELASDTLYRLSAAALPPPPVSGHKHRAAATESHVDPQLSAEWMTLRLNQPPGGGVLVLEIDNGDSPPLSGLQVEVYGSGARLIFEYPRLDAQAAPNSAPRWTLYYGNPAARAPHYDLEGLRERLTRLGPLRPAQLLAEQQNPRFHQAPPLQFVPAVGAPLSSERFRLQQALRFLGEGGPDIYAVTLDPATLGLLRSDLGDVRIVDAQDRQVPYVLSADADEVRAELLRAPEPRPRLSRYRLTAGGAAAGPALALPLQAVELLVRDTFYSRPFRLLKDSPEDGSPRIVLSGTLRRQGDDGGLHSLPLSGERQRELFLEIDDQDNPPLTIERISAVVRAPRLFFKLMPGDGYRLLLGDPESSPPHYDIESLRQAVLAYAALPAQLGSLEPNRAYRSRASDYLLHAPPTALLWGSLLLAVAVLLAITIRLLGKTPPPE